jgi:hypothetical protein
MTELNLTLTLDETNLVLTSLGELPAKVSLSLINKIRGQASPQLQPPSDEPKS